MRHYGLFLPAFGLFALAPQLALASEPTRVATAFEEDNKFDLHLGVDYDFQYKRASILREWNTGRSSEVLLAKDLIYKQWRHTVEPKLEIGLWHDLAVYVSLPVVIDDRRTYEFDKSGDPCRYGDDSSSVDAASCVNKDNSTTIRDGIVPTSGFDATTASAPFSQFTGAGTNAIFKAPSRKGLDQLNVGIKYGILSQRALSHMPDWLIGFEGRFAVGKAMRFTREIQNGDDSANHRVGRRIHELGVWTALGRRFRFLDPFITGYWRQSVRASNSQFENLGGAQDKVNPQSRAGFTVGTEIVPWERPAKKQKFSLLLQGSGELRYGGRAYSEVWELLSDSPALVGARDPRQGASCDPAAAIAYAEQNPGDTAGYVNAGGSSCEAHNGITDVQDYAVFGLTGSVNFHMGPYARLQLGALATTETRHFLSFANRGDANGDGGTDDSRVESNTGEVNPVRRDIIDNVGRRYAIDDALSVYGYFKLMLTF